MATVEEEAIEPIAADDLKHVALEPAITAEEGITADRDVDMERLKRRWRVLRDN